MIIKYIKLLKNKTNLNKNKKAQLNFIKNIKLLFFNIILFSAIFSVSSSNFKVNAQTGTNLGVQMSKLTVAELQNSNISCQNLKPKGLATCIFNTPDIRDTKNLQLGIGVNPGGSCKNESNLSTKIICENVPVQNSFGEAVVSFSYSSPTQTSKILHIKPSAVASEFDIVGVANSNSSSSSSKSISSSSSSISVSSSSSSSIKSSVSNANYNQFNTTVNEITGKINLQADKSTLNIGEQQILTANINIPEINANTVDICIFKINTGSGSANEQRVTLANNKCVYTVPADRSLAIGNISAQVEIIAEGKKYTSNNVNWVIAGDTSIISSTIRSGGGVAMYTGFAFLLGFLVWYKIKKRSPTAGKNLKKISK